MKTKEVYITPKVEVIEMELTTSIMLGSNITGSGNADGNTSAYSKRRFGWEEE